MLRLTAEWGQVVTPLELLSHLQEEDIALAALQPSPPLYGIPSIDSFVHRASADGILHGCGESSGGLAKHAFEHAALHRFGQAVVADFVKVKNADHREATLVVDGQVVLRASLTYGFRNIQNLVRPPRARLCAVFSLLSAAAADTLHQGPKIDPAFR